MSSQSDARRLRLNASRAMLHAAPSATSEAVSELLYNETVAVEETADGWVKILADTDGYRGWATRAAFVDAPEASDAPRLRCRALASFGHARPDLESPDVWVSCGTQITVDDEAWVQTPGASERVRLLRDANGLWFPTAHFDGVTGLDGFAPLAHQFVGTPYLWGGRTSRGLDCSALVQQGLAACGRDCPRDTSVQVKTVGELLPGVQRADLARGDLLFWPGHVVIYLADGLALHADGTAMMVKIEAIDSIAAHRGVRVEDMIVRRPI